MARTKGAKDSRPRRMNPVSLLNIPTPSHAEAVARNEVSWATWVRASSRAKKWWDKLNPVQRGQYIDLLLEQGIEIDGD